MEDDSVNTGGLARLAERAGAGIGKGFQTLVDAYSAGKSDYEAAKNAQIPVDPAYAQTYYGSTAPSPVLPDVEVPDAAMLPQQPIPQQPAQAVPQQPSASQFEPRQVQQEVALPQQTADAEAAKGLVENNKMQQKSAKALGEYQAKKLEAEANERDLLDQRLMEREARMTKLAEETNLRVDEELKQLDSYRQNLKQFNASAPKIENRGPFSANASTGQKIMAGIAIVLGGVGGALTGKGDNIGLDIINAAIDRDLQLQKDNAKLQLETDERNLRVQKMTGDASQSMLAVLNQRFDNQMQAESAARALMLESAKNRLESVSAKYSAPEARAKAQLLAQQLEEEQIKEVHKFRAASEQKQMLSALGKKMSSSELPQLNPAEMAQLPKEVREAYEAQLERTVPGYGTAVNKEQAKKFNEYIAETGPALTNAKQVYELGKRLNLGSKMAPSQRAEIESRLAILAGQLRLPITGPGALTPEEYTRLRETIGDPKKIMGLKAVELKKLDTVIQFLQQSINERATQAGLRKSDINRQLGFKPVK